VDTGVVKKSNQEKARKCPYHPITFSQREIDEGFDHFVQMDRENKTNKKNCQQIGLTQ